jgi:hypothetical protein
MRSNPFSPFQTRPLPLCSHLPARSSVFTKLACLLVAICAASPFQRAHADPSDQLYPGLTVIAPAGKDLSTITIEKAQCAEGSQGNIEKYATCLEDLQYVLPGSATKVAPMPLQQTAPLTSTPMPEGPARAHQEGASDSGLYRQIAKVAATGDIAFNTGNYASAMRNFLIIDSADSSIAANASQFDFTADLPTSGASPAREQAYEEVHDLIIAQRNIGLMYERGWGEAQSYMMAAGWYDRALSHGLPDAQAEGHLGVLLGNGLGIPKNTDRAAQLLEQSHSDDLLVLLKHGRLPRTFDVGADPATAQLAARLRAQENVPSK